MAEVASRVGALSRQRCILAIDTALGAASACLLEMNASKPLAAESLPMQRGHAEALIPLLDRLVARLDGGFEAVGRVAVTIGPGSFTGIRVGVSAARAVGLACRVPVVGVSTLQALAAPAIAAKAAGTLIAAIDARHGSVYAQIFGPNGTTLMEACHRSVADVIEAAGPGPLRLVGSGAPMLAIEAWSRGRVADVDSQAAAPDIALVARLGALADPDPAGPKPLYLKAPDAKPSATLVRRLPDPIEPTPADA
ncbi:tRNA (adenosine(37)-N6)-threonylcarbamoyltransferase complex dimerization subunit type 1 TsaB [Lichenihabitans sp. Uapishka_5]|uniref:tRNA (adenosine(37)-N6)-threonylcarbamoyltransferase complex dimerization subunit type 1 TsaB n=1 Tax=Lichenihabitans sp. Uapishka_5 TaxID=3037302 RepID=UPI0029E813D9|nr:tRNA (adenosine(37)-N6)-threonylcarbamoyltransferase complex dimerization subunit type 1 TsaB [Lichenihabitans sp. Uapishka_5]MDX7951073.1 tRNA (adenosine(37)-N6)-threonylcarbamoyltransferase complex dimerization subunit type 1 TsaB [Lichenihabitans sp. Uapishka_5]